MDNTTNFEKEDVRLKLIETAKRLAEIAEQKEDVRLKLIETAKQLAEIAEKKENDRLRLVETAKRLAVIAETMKFKLEESREKFSTIFEQSPIAIEYYDAEGCLLTVNNACINLFGVIDKNKIFGFKLFDDPHISPDIKSKLLSKETIRYESKFNFEEAKKAKLYQTTKSGILYLDWHIAPLSNGDKIAGYIVQIQDITERKKMESELRELDTMKDNFLATTSHELKTPLVPIIVQAQLLLENVYGGLNQEQIQALDMIVRNAHTLNLLSAEILDIAKMKSNKLMYIFEKISLSEIIINAINDFKIKAKEKNIIIVLKPFPILSPISADKIRIAQVVNNLLDNAIKFTLNSGTIEIEVKKSETEVVVIVKDTGIGISPDNIKEISKPFFQIDSNINRKYRGTGLGLAISKAIVESHGGKMWLASTGEGNGTTVSFSLPIINSL